MPPRPRITPTPPVVPISKPHPRRPIRRRILLPLFLLIAAIISLHEYLTYRGLTPPTPIFQGVTYSCEEIPGGPQGDGKMYLVEVDLTAPGIDLYTTPLDPAAVSRGWEYRLRYSRFVVDDENLAVVVNGVLFTPDARFPYPGADARSIETLVSDHVVNHPYPYNWFLGFDDHLNPALPDHRPPTPQDLARARWGIGSQMRILIDGRVNPWATDKPDCRTMLAINPATRRLWLACFDNISGQYAARILAGHGATDAITLDGGHSTTMSLGHAAANIHPGLITGHYAPTATFFGLRANPLPGH